MAKTIVSSEFLKQGYRDYAMYALLRRAYPSAADGLKVVQRMAMYLLANRAEKINTGSLVGAMREAKLYNHGDQAGGDAVSRLASPYVNNIPMIEPDSDGGFGSVVDRGAISSARYTTVKRSKFAQQVMYIDMDCAPTEFNNDKTGTMPAHLLPLVPVVLLNGVWGNAPGYSPVNIFPRDFDDLVKAVLNVLDGKPPGKLVPKYYGQNLTIKREKTETDEVKWSFEGKFERIKSDTLMVTELPPGMTLEKFKLLLEELERAPSIKPPLGKQPAPTTVLDFLDHSARGIKVEIRFSRSWMMDATDEDIIKLLKLRESEAERLIVVSYSGNALIEFKNTTELVEDFVKWRFGYYEVRYKKLLIEQETIDQYWSSVLACFKNGVPAKAIAVKDRAALAELIETAVKKEKIKVEQSITDRICNIPLFRWTAEGERDAKEKLAAARALITEYKAILKSPEKRKAIYRDEVAVLKARAFQ